LQGWKPILLRALITASASTGLNFDNLHSHEAARCTASFCPKAKQNGLFDPAHQLVKALGPSVIAWKLGNRGNVVAVFVSSDHDIESHAPISCKIVK
jgi:hypothetical protein